MAVGQSFVNKHVKVIMLLSQLAVVLTTSDFDLPVEHLNILCNRKPEVCSKSDNVEVNTLLFLSTLLHISFREYLLLIR